MALVVRCRKTRPFWHPRPSSIGFLMYLWLHVSAANLLHFNEIAFFEVFCTVPTEVIGECIVTAFNKVPLLTNPVFHSYGFVISTVHCTSGTNGSSAMVRKTVAGMTFFDRRTWLYQYEMILQLRRFMKADSDSMHF